MTAGFTSVVLSSLERRFRLSSTITGILLVFFDISVMLSVIFISYFGDKRHKPRWLGYGLLIQGVGALLFALPQFIFGEYSTNALSLESCTVGEDFNPSDDGPNLGAYFIMLLGNVLIGIGAAPLFTLGLSFIDDITYPKYVPIHMGIFYVAVAVGPAIGYGLGGAFLSVYVDPWVTPAPHLNESNPHWVGAWWLCFVFSGVLSLIIAFPFFLFPRVLPNHSKVVEMRNKEHATSYSSKFKHEASIQNQAKALPFHLWKLCKSKSFVFVTLAISFLFLTLYGLVAFGPKFIESVFNIPASVASILAGAVGKFGLLIS
jgi:organic anion transporter 4A